jgi:hypothetical protein
MKYYFHMKHSPLGSIPGAALKYVADFNDWQTTVWQPLIQNNDNGCLLGCEDMFGRVVAQELSSSIFRTEVIHLP